MQHGAFHKHTSRFYRMKLSLIPHTLLRSDPIVFDLFSCRARWQLVIVASASRSDMDMTPRRRSDIPLQASQHIADSMQAVISLQACFELSNFAGRSILETTLYTRQSMYTVIANVF